MRFGLTSGLTASGKFVVSAARGLVRNKAERGEGGGGW